MTTDDIARRACAHLHALDITPVSDLGVRVAGLLEVLAAGIYHVPARELLAVDWSNPAWIEVRWGQNLATYDGDRLTRLVFLAHDAALRVEVEPRSAKYLTLRFHPRTREGHISQRHPTLREAVALHRELYPEEAK